MGWTDVGVEGVQERIQECVAVTLRARHNHNGAGRCLPPSPSPAPAPAPVQIWYLASAGANANCRVMCPQLYSSRHRSASVVTHVACQWCVFVYLLCDWRGAGNLLPRSRRRPPTLAANDRALAPRLIGLLGLGLSGGRHNIRLLRLLGCKKI